MFAKIILPYDKKVNYRTFNDDMLIKAIDNYLKINGVRKKYHQYPTHWFRYARSGRFERICSTESFKLIERSFMQIYGCAAERKIVFSHQQFSKMLRNCEMLCDCDEAAVIETVNYVVSLPSPSAESMEPSLVNVADIYSECYKAFMGWYEDFKNIYGMDTTGFTTIARAVNIIKHFTETNGFGMDIPTIMSLNFYATYWRMICIINMLSIMMSWGGFTKMHTSSDSESVETNDAEEEDNNDET